jgi:hypothetical protein
VITQLPRAFRDGIILFKLAAALYPHAEQPNYNKAPKMRPQAIDNVSMALKLIEKYGPELRFTQVEQLVDCDPKMTLGMVWSIVHHHQIRAIQVGALHGKDGLLLWCKRIAQPQGVEIANFTTSWRDGAAFTCIVAALVGQDKLPLAPVLDQRVSGAARDHLARAFAVAEAELGVPQLLTPDDLLDERPDEKSVLTYVSELFRVGASRTAHSSAFEPEDGGAVLGAILAWQKSESERRAVASNGAESDVDRWRALAQQRSAYIQRWADDACAALDAAAAISTSKAPLRDIRNVAQKQLAELSPSRHISALLGRLRQQNDRDDSIAIEALRSADVALERVKARLAADGGDDARAAPAAAAAAAGPSAANNPDAQAALSVYNDQVSALLSALAVTRSAANGLAAAADNKETALGDLRQLQAESQERAAALLEAPLETLQQLTQLDAHHADMHRRAGASLQAFVAETDAFVEFCIAQCER